MAKIILIVDDSETMIMSVSLTLEMSGFQVETANDGIAALTKLKSGLKPDLIITDINMPNMDGIEFIKNVRILKGYSFIPILTLTTESDASKRDLAKKIGATGWIVKPVIGTDLINAIRHVLPGD